jgi:serine/threonine-protein kinase
VRNGFIATGTGVVLLGFLLLYACTGGPGNAVVPKVTGESYARAAATLDDRGFHVERRSVHSLQTRGTVLDQSVRPGRRVSTDRTITLTVASGPRTYSINADDYIGRPGEDVAAELTAKGLSVQTAFSPTTEVTPGTVTDVAPSGSVREGTTVTVTVAVGLTGKPPKPEPHGHEKKPHGH